MRKIIIFSIALVMFLTVNAVANDTKVYPGSMGAKKDSSQPEPYLNYGSIQNPSSNDWLWLFLPVVRDSSACAINSGWVKAFDMHYSENISARLCSVSRLGSTFTMWSSARKTSGSNTSTQTLSFGSLPSVPGGHYFFYCAIPPVYQGNRSAIVSYMINEESSDNVQ